MLPAILSAGLKIASFGMTLSKTIKAAKQEKKARQVLDNFQRQQLKNVAQKPGISLLGAQMKTEEAQRRLATNIDALKAGGVRALVGGLQPQEQMQQRVQQEIASFIDLQQVKAENLYAQLRAEDQANIREMQEDRDAFDYMKKEEELAQLGQEKIAGIQSLFGQAFDFIGSLKKPGDPKVGGLSSLQNQSKAYFGASDRDTSSARATMFSSRGSTESFGSNLGSLKALAAGQGYYERPPRD